MGQQKILRLSLGMDNPNQQQNWEIVHIGKISSWLVSFMIVDQLKNIKEFKEQPETLSARQ